MNSSSRSSCVRKSSATCTAPVLMPTEGSNNIQAVGSGAMNARVSQGFPQNLAPGDAHLLVDVGDGLEALPVHVQDLQERLVHPLVVREARLRAIEQV